MENKEKKKRLSYNEKLNEAIKHLVNYQFELNGYNLTYEDVLKIEKWFNEYTTTPEKGDEFKTYGVKYLMKYLKMRKYRAETEMSWFILGWGLREITETL